MEPEQWAAGEKAGTFIFHLITLVGGCGMLAWAFNDWRVGLGAALIAIYIQDRARSRPQLP